MTISTSFHPHPSQLASRTRCTTEGCGGEILRHSLGCGMATGRCTRCFTRYNLADTTTPVSGATASSRRPLQRLLHDFITWQEED